MIKFESPIKNLLPNGVDTTMAIPDATPGPNPNTPPIVGLVYLREPIEDDELGQYSTSPNVIPSPENDENMSNRKAYIFTPILQMKMANSFPASFSGNNSGISTPVQYNSNIIANNLQETDLDKSYTSSVNRYRQLLQQQQQQLQQTQHEKATHRVESRRGFTPTASTIPLSSQHSGPSYHTSTSTYSNLITGGILSYSLVDEGNKLSRVSDALNIKRRKLEAMEDVSGNEIVWYRAPPLSVSNRILSNDITDLGHSAQYIAWKLKQEH